MIFQRSIYRRIGLEKIFLSLLLLSVPFLLQAHEGHEDTAPTPSAATNSIQRATAQSESFEIVIVPQHEKLVIYLDRFTDNVPVSGATLELESDGWQGKAKEIHAGTYTVAAPFLAKPGQYSLLITLTQEDQSDLLETTLDTNTAKHSSAATKKNTPVLIILSTSATMLLLLFFMLRRRRLVTRR
jgi:membrane fusion protein, heavy metal efflux system